MDWFQILVIILSIFLGVFLILGIVLTVIVIKLTRQIQDIAENTKVAVTRLARTATNVSNMTSAAYFGRFAKKFFKKLKNR